MRVRRSVMSMSSRALQLLGLGIGALCVVLACSPATSKRGVTLGSGGSGNGSGGTGTIDIAGTLGSGIVDLGCDPSVPADGCSPDAPAPAGCGDGMRAEDEACDDGNRNDGDGCQGNCLATQPGYSCNPRPALSRTRDLR